MRSYGAADVMIPVAMRAPSAGYTDARPILASRLRRIKALSLSCASACAPLRQQHAPWSAMNDDTGRKGRKRTASGTSKIKENSNKLKGRRSKLLS